MKILKKTSTKLVFQKGANANFTSFIKGYLLFVILPLALFIGAYVTFFHPISISLNCVRIQPDGGNCQLINRWLVGSTTQNIPIKDLYGAELKEVFYEIDGEVDRTRIPEGYQVFILTSSGRQELFSFNKLHLGNRQEKQEIVFKIGSFVGNPSQTNLSISENYTELVFAARLTGGLLFIGFILISAFGIAIKFLISFIFYKVFDIGDTIRLYTFDKNIQLFIISCKKAFKAETTNKYSIHELSGIQIIKLEDEDSDSSEYYQVELVLTSGEKIKFDNYSNLSESRMHKEVSLIRSFLGLD